MMRGAAFTTILVALLTILPAAEAARDVWAGGGSGYAKLEYRPRCAAEFALTLQRANATSWDATLVVAPVPEWRTPLTCPPRLHEFSGISGSPTTGWILRSTSTGCVHHNILVDAVGLLPAGLVHFTYSIYDSCTGANDYGEGTLALAAAIPV